MALRNGADEGSVRDEILSRRKDDPILDEGRLPSMQQTLLVKANSIHRTLTVPCIQLGSDVDTIALEDEQRGYVLIFEMYSVRFPDGKTNKGCYSDERNKKGEVHR